MRRQLAAAAALASLAVTMTGPAVSATPVRTLPACASDEGPDGQANRGCVYDARHLGNGIGRSFVIRRDADANHGTLTYVSHARAHLLLFGVQS